MEPQSRLAPAFAFLDSLPDAGPSEWTIDQIRGWTECPAVGHHEYAQAALRKLLARIAELEADPRVLGHENGPETIELHQREADGFAVFTGTEGEAPDFCAFFTHEKDAEAFTAMRDLDDPECPRLRDPAIVVAVLTEQGVIAANDYKIETHEQLRARIAEARSKPPCKP